MVPSSKTLIGHVFFLIIIFTCLFCLFVCIVSFLILKSKHPHGCRPFFQFIDSRWNQRHQSVGSLCQCRNDLQNSLSGWKTWLYPSLEIQNWSQSKYLNSFFFHAKWLKLILYSFLLEHRLRRCRSWRRRWRWRFLDPYHRRDGPTQIGRRFRRRTGWAASSWSILRLFWQQLFAFLCQQNHLPFEFDSS